MCHRRDDDVGADGQRVLVAVAVGVRVGELLPAVAQVEPAVDDGEPSVERDSRQAGGALRAEVLSYAGRVLDLADVVMRVVERVVQRDRRELLLG